ncbi:MAG: DUF1573 domain-containing protein [Bacteroidetes bacterium]|nr:DUF1573 domain-containing protein [Bacteroidota bacterium]
MKKLLFLALAFCTANVFAQKKADDIAKFNVESFDFGKVEQNHPATATFVIKNISNEPLVIDQAAPSCGCTVSDYTKSPIAPGKTGTIKATFNAAAMGPIDKTITVKLAGIDDVKFLKLKGEVVAPSTSSVKKK